MRCLRVAGLLVVLLALLPWRVQAQQFTSTTVIKTFENDTTTGTTLNYLAKIVPGTSGRGKVVRAAVTDTTIDLYVVVLNAGTSGSATILLQGDVACVFDATNASGKAGKYVVNSTTTPGQCHVQDNPPTSGMVLGKMSDDATTAGQLANYLANNQNYQPASGTTGTGTVTSVGMTVPLEFTIAGQPIVGAGVLALAKATQPANCVMAGPASGAAAVWACRPLVVADLPGTAVGSCGTTGDLTGTYPNCTVIKASSTFALAGKTTVTLAGPGDNYAGCPNAVCYIDGGVADRRISGFAAPTQDGDTKEVCNGGTANLLTLGAEDTNSSAANRLNVSDDLIMAPRECALLRYSTTATRWKAPSTAAPAWARLKTITLIIGDTSSTAPTIPDDSDTPNAWTNLTGRRFLITAAACASNVASGVTPTVMAILKGPGTNIFTGDCTCGTALAFQACVIAGQPVVEVATGAGATCSTPPCIVDIRTQLGAGTYYTINLVGILR